MGCSILGYSGTITISTAWTATNFDLAPVVLFAPIWGTPPQEWPADKPRQLHNPARTPRARRWSWRGRATWG